MQQATSVGRADHGFLGRLLAAGALLAAAAPASAQVFDLSISKIEVNQAIQNGSIPLAGGRTTFVRATVRASDPPTIPVLVDGLLRVFVDGVEEPGSPIFSDNGPYAAFPPGQVPPLANENATLNFVFLPPEAGNVVLEVQVNPAGPNFVPEPDTTNNTFSTLPLTFGFLRVTEMAYAPIDYRPSGGPIPNLPDPNLIQSGVGDNFVHGIYPTKDWYYHRTDAPSKLWTSSLSGSGSPLLNSLQVDIALMDPAPDFLYGWVPGGLPYNGQSIIGGNVCMGNTELIRFQRTLAHEIGHNFGLQHNGLTVNLVGVDIEHHLAITQGLPQIKAGSLNDIMVAGLLTPQAWVALPSFNVFLNAPVFDPQDAAATDSGGAPALMVAGLLNRSTGALQLTDVLTLPRGALTAPAAPHEAELVVAAFAGGSLVQSLPLAIRSSPDTCADAADGSADSAQPLTEAGFSAVLPAASAAGMPIDRLLIAGGSVAAAAAPVAPLELQRTSAAPQVAFTAPGAGALGAAIVHVAWEAADADGDELHYYLRYSPDGGQRFVPILTSTTASSIDVDLDALPALLDGQAFFELFASDGLNTTAARSPVLTGGHVLGLGSNEPWVDVITPDTGTSILQGATLILHSSGWDIEDRALDGASIVWTSDLDGVIGTGRLTSSAGLSVGTHVLTVQATDSTALTASDTTTITVVERGLPTLGEPVCQADLGFGGPGASVLSVCGGDLSAGTSADLLLVNAPANAASVLLIGVVNAPVGFKGGTLVPVPWIAVVPMTTDGDGELSLVAGVPGGGGPLTAFVQCIVADAGQPLGIGLSNALQLDFLP